MNKNLPGKKARVASKMPKPAKSRPLCPACGSAKVLATVHGIPTPAQAKAIKQGTAMIADREEWEGMSEWYCNNCGCDWSRHSRRFKKPGGVNATESNR